VEGLPGKKLGRRVQDALFLFAVFFHESLPLKLQDAEGPAAGLDPPGQY
jgi:hypothetical protein